jgi:hypothetical protein
MNSTTKAKPFSFTTDSSTSFVDHASDYELSIVRFSVDSASAALFIPQIIPNQPDLNKTIYTVTLSIRELTSGPVNVIWRPQDLTASMPQTTAYGFQDNSTGYYQCTSYNWFTMLIQEAFNTALDLLRTSDVDIIDDALPPLIFWSNASSSASLEVQTAFYDQSPSGPDNCIEIYMNQPLYALFNSMPAQFMSANDVNGQNYRIMAYKLASINTDVIETSDGVSQEFISIPQEISTTMSWSPYVSIVFTSSTIPVATSINLPTQVFIDNAQIYSGNQLANSELILTDLQTNDGVYRSSIVYNPSVYRFISLAGDQAIKKIDINIYWRTKWGELIPFRLDSGGSVSMKLAFHKLKK